MLIRFTHKDKVLDPLYTSVLDLPEEISVV